MALGVDNIPVRMWGLRGLLTLHPPTAGSPRRHLSEEDFGCRRGFLTQRQLTVGFPKRHHSDEDLGVPTAGVDFRTLRGNSTVSLPTSMHASGIPRWLEAFDRTFEQRRNRDMGQLVPFCSSAKEAKLPLQGLRKSTMAHITPGSSEFVQTVSNGDSKGESHWNRYDNEWRW